MYKIYDKMSDFIMVLDLINEVIFCNQSILNRLKYSIDEIKQSNKLNNIIDKSTIDKLTQQEEINIVLELQTKSDEVLKIDANISIQNIENEKSILIIGKEVQSKLHNLEMLEDLLDNINTSTFILDDKGKFLYVNKSFTNVVNKEKEEIIGTYNSNHWECNVYKQLDENNQEVIKNKEAKIFTESIDNKKDINWYESYKAPVFNESGSLKYMVAETKNITLSKTLSEQIYKDSNNTLMNNNFDDSKDCLDEILMNIGKRILDYTQSDGIAVFLYDKVKEALVPTVVLGESRHHLNNIEMVPVKSEDLNSDKYLEHFNRVRKVEKIDVNYIVSEERISNINYLANYIIKIDEEIIGFIGFCYCEDNYPKYNSDEFLKHICNQMAIMIKNKRLTKEISIQNKNRACLEKELEQYLSVSVDLVAIIGIDGRFKRLSPNWFKVLGWSEEELLQKNIKELTHPKESSKHLSRRLMETMDGKSTRKIIQLKHKNGQYIKLEWNSKYLAEEGIFITTARDMTRKLKIENEKKLLEEAVELETVKNEFFSNISHEFRTPINIILGTTQVINKNIEKNNIEIGNLWRHTNYIKQNSYRLLKLVNNLIDITRMDIGMYELKCSNENIINIIEDITLSVVDFTKSRYIDIVFDTDEEEVITYCDPDKIERIVLNLLSNAIKYTKENGTIMVTISTKENEVVVSIKDTGIGIPKEKLDVIFNRFGQVDDSLNRKCEGSGIGLSLVKNLVKLHGGEINVDSEVGIGTEFIFTIPIKVEDKDDINIYDVDRKYKHVERCDIEFSDIYNT